MTETTLVGLRRLLLDRYDDLSARLTRRLGSAELASDAAKVPEVSRQDRQW